MKRATEFEVFRTCEKPGRSCPHTPNVEYWVDDCVTQETADRIADRVVAQPGSGTCGMQPVVYEVTKTYKKIR